MATRTQLADGFRFLFEPTEKAWPLGGESERLYLSTPHIVTVCEHGECYVDGRGSGGQIVPGLVLSGGSHYVFRWRGAPHGSGDPVSLFSPWTVEIREALFFGGRLNGVFPYPLRTSRRIPWVRNQNVPDTLSATWTYQVPAAGQIRVEIEGIGTLEYEAGMYQESSGLIGDRVALSGTMTEDAEVIEVDCPAGGGLFYFSVTNRTGAAVAVSLDLGWLE